MKFAEKGLHSETSPATEKVGEKKRVVVKVGSNVLTRDDGKLDVTRMCFEFAEQLLSSGNRMISIEDFHDFVVQNSYLIDRKSVV